MGIDTGEAETGNEERHQKKVGYTGQPAETTEENEVVHHSCANQRIRLVWFIQEDAIFACLNTASEALMLARGMAALVIED
jgi:hypothetical protein